MAFRPSYGMPSYHHNYAPQQQQIVFGQMRMPGQHQPAASQKQQEPTPVFVGNIPEKCTDEFIQKILNECGSVSSWKRITGSNGKLQGFGFCNFADLEGTLRALRILHEFHLGDKKLTVKAEEKVRSELRKTAIENRKKQGKKELKLKEGELPADEDDLKKDEEIRLKILHWMETDHKDLLSIAEDGEIAEELKKAKPADADKEVGSVSNKKDDRNRRRRSRSREIRSARRSRSASPRNKKSRRSRSSSGSSSSSGTSSSRSSSYSSRSRSRSPLRSKHSKRRRSTSRTSEDSEDAREKRLMKQMMKEKEQAYHSRLKRWESRERQMAKKYEKEERREKDRKKNLQKECKKLKTFLEDYEDERDDPKFFKSSLYFQRKRDYEREREADQKDRIQEQQEIEELKKQIMLEVQNGLTIDVDQEAMKRHQQKLQEEDARRKMRDDSGSPNPHQPLGQTNGVNGETESSDEESGSEKNSEKVVKEEVKVEVKEEPMDTSEPPAEAPQNGGGWKAIGDDSQTATAQITRPQPSSAPSSSAVKRETASPLPIAQRLNGVFGNDDEEDEMHKRKKLKPFEITREERMQVMSADEKKELTKQIIKKIPMTKEELFIHKIEWDQLDQQWMKDRVRPWVSKKTVSFFGEEDQSLCDFICEQLEKQVSPEQMLKDVAVIIDDDAEQFVIKLWRLLIYEGQARRMGIT